MMKEEIIRLREEGHTIREIAKKIGIVPSHVHYYTSRHKNCDVISVKNKYNFLTTEKKKSFLRKIGGKDIRITNNNNLICEYGIFIPICNEEKLDHPNNL